jgi:hypothetical protein
MCLLTVSPNEPSKYPDREKNTDEDITVDLSIWSIYIWIGRKISSVRLKIEQNQLVIDGRCTCSGGIGLQGA